MSSAALFAPAGGDRDVLERAEWTAIELGERLLFESNPNYEDPHRQWIPGRGLMNSSGFALAFAALAQATGDSRFEAAAHAQLRTAARVEDLPTAGLMDGISGLRAAAALAAVEEPRYGRLVDQCDAFVEANLPPVPYTPTSFCDFDLITGWGGVRLSRCVTGPGPRDRTIDHLAWTIADESRWRCVHPVTQNDENDLGLAHGIAGMLAAVTLTLDDPDDALIESVSRAAWQLADRSFELGGLTVWPMSVQAPPRTTFRVAWCYGAAGVASSLYTAARWLHDAALERFALDALIRLAAGPRSAWQMSDEAICHGTSGNALIFASVAAASGEPALHDVAVQLVVETVDRLERNNGRCISWQEGVGDYPAVGELTGIAGIVLALLTIAGHADAAWMRCHALQPLR